MPTYSFKNKEDDSLFEKFFNSSAKKDEFLAENPSYTQVLNAIPAVSPHSVGRTKTDGQFRETISQMRQNHPTGNIGRQNLSEF